MSSAVFSLHHTRTTATPVRKMRKASAAMPLAAKGVEANTTLIAPVYRADGVTCNPFVHTVSKRLIGVGAAFTALVLAVLIAVRRHGGVL